MEHFADARAKKRLEKLLNNVPAEIVESADFVAGGAITSVFSRSPIQDLDFFFREDAVIKAGNIASSLKDGCWEFPISKTDNAVTVKTEDSVCQLVKCIEGGPATIVNSFDFTVTQGLYSIADKEFYVSDHFFKDLAARRLILTSSVPYPYNTLVRILKYKDKGFSIPLREVVKLSVHCSKVDLSSVAKFKAELQGVESRYLEEFFEKCGDNLTMENILDELENFEGQIDDSEDQEISSDL